MDPQMQAYLGKYLQGQNQDQNGNPADDGAAAYQRMMMAAQNSQPQANTQMPQGMVPQQAAQPIPQQMPNQPSPMMPQAGLNSGQMPSPQQAGNAPSQNPLEGQLQAQYANWMRQRAMGGGMR